MASYLIEASLANGIGRALAKKLNNELSAAWISNDITSISDSMCFKFKNKEIFGDLLTVEIDRICFGGLPIDQIIDSALCKAIEKLPREDRLHRARIWGIKCP
jgi:hypothetical protein